MVVQVVQGGWLGKDGLQSLGQSRDIGNRRKAGGNGVAAGTCMQPPTGPLGGDHSRRSCSHRGTGDRQCWWLLGPGVCVAPEQTGLRLRGWTCLCGSGWAVVGPCRGMLTLPDLHPASLGLELLSPAPPWGYMALNWHPG